MGQGYYGAEYVKTKDGDYDYQGQVNRLHNLRQWDRKANSIAAAPAPLSLDEMQERWNAHDWLIKDSKHFESDVIRKVDEEAENRKKAKNEAEERTKKAELDVQFEKYKAKYLELLRDISGTICESKLADYMV